jgi:colanic acid biosynthesis glycosyl transferase WcaI
MKVLVVCQNYVPEEQNAYHHELTTGLLRKGHDVTMLTAFPHYGLGRVYDGYRGKIFQREVIDGVKVARTFVYATRKKTFLPRLLNFASFCISSLLFGSFVVRRADVVYTSIPPLPLGITGYVLAKLKGARYVVSIQDIFPLAAVELGMLKNPRVIRFFEAMERWIYRRADHIVVIAEAFRENLIAKGVPADKITVVSNWANPDFITTGPKDNALRREFGVGDLFTVIYSGGLTHNSNVGSLVEAADILRDEPFAFLIIGEGVQKPKLQALAAEKNLRNLRFLPFRPLAEYPLVLQAADMNVVALNSKATLVSVPSKIYKQMAAGRPVLAISSHENELARLVTEGKCGLVVPPDEPEKIAEALRWARNHPAEMSQMGPSGRAYLMENCSLERSMAGVDAMLRRVVSVTPGNMDTTNLQARSS